jgi:hypothetical protein
MLDGKERLSMFVMHAEHELKIVTTKMEMEMEMEMELLPVSS